MKKAKIMLMGLAICVVVSGALAFKSAKSTRNLWHCSIQDNMLTCVTALYKTTNIVGVEANMLFTGPGTIPCIAVNGTVGCNGVHPQFATVANQ